MESHGRRKWLQAPMVGSKKYKRMLHFFQFHVFAKTNGKFYTAFGDYFIEGKFWSEISHSKIDTSLGLVVYT
jgi:hypothetical protein